MVVEKGMFVRVAYIITHSSNNCFLEEKENDPG